MDLNFYYPPKPSKQPAVHLANFRQSLDASHRPEDSPMINALTVKPPQPD